MYITNQLLPKLLISMMIRYGTVD